LSQGSANKEIVLFESIDDEYLRERANDISDAAKRLVKNILGIPIKDIGEIRDEAVLVGREVTPSQIVSLNKKYIKGIIAETGGPTSHTAIIARNLEIPAVLGARGITSALKDSQLAAVNGSKGIIILPSSGDEEESLRELIQKHSLIKEEMRQLTGLPAETSDGHRVEIAANIGLSGEAGTALDNGAEGIGLFRTEFLYMDRKSMPDEQEQYKAYREAVEAMNGKPVIIRTLDIGGDKEIPYFKFPVESNPFLGWRAIRICLDMKEMFATQLRAILRASAFGKVRIMYPMISSVEEVLEANAFLEGVKESLRMENIGFDNEIEVGVMIEIPSAAIAADLIIKNVDFFSIGTNDLTQYTLAVDRGNEKVSSYYRGFHPSVLRLIKNVIDVSHRAGKFTGMCGELAGNPLATVMLLGMGLDEFSMSPASMRKIKKIVRSVDFEFAKRVADSVIGLSTAKEVEDYMNKILSDLKLDYLLEV